MQVRFWQIALTAHQSFTLDALARNPDCQVQVYEVESRQPQRGGLQWTEAADDAAPHVLRKRINTLREGRQEIRGSADVLHLFSGIWSNRRLFVLLLYALLKRRRVGLLTEPYLDVAVGYFADQSWLKAQLKKWLRSTAYRIAGLLLRRRIAVVFAISRRAVSQFQRLGFDANRIYPFGYFVTRLETKDPSAAPAQGSFNVAFVGSMTTRKGLHVLSSAMQCVPPHVRLQLDLFGPGEFPAALANERVRYRGVIPFGTAQATLRAYRALVCPSLFDGWGVVVNEALLQGLPVIVSRQTGAAAMVENHELGLVFDATDADDLAQKFTLLASDDELYAKLKRNIRRFIPELAPARAAEYMYLCLLAYRNGTPPPACPWY